MSAKPFLNYDQFLSRTLCGTKIYIVAAVFLLASCKKDSNLGLEIQPTGDLIDLQASDTLTLLTYTVREDSIRSDEAKIVQIGTINDAIFGNSSASLFTQFSIPNNLLNINFGATAVLDSCFLNLAYDFDYYGDTLSQQTFSVYQLTQDIYKDSGYYSNRAMQCYPSFANRISIGDTTISPRPRSKIVVGTDTLKAQLRIPIQYNFAQQVFSQSGGANLASNTAFHKYLKGLFIESQSPSLNPGQGALSRFNLLDTTTKLTFYYHTVTDTLTFSFIINASTAYYSRYTHDYSTISNSLTTQLANQGVNTSNEVYVSACAGVKTKIEFPYLNDLINLPYSIAINKAELVIKADPSTASDNFPINKQLYVVSIDSLGQQTLLLDMFENSIYFGGAVNTNTSEYKINIARYFQELMAGEKPNNGLFLKELDPNSQGRRAVLGSANQNSTYKMYLHLVYTRIN